MTFTDSNYQAFFRRGLLLLLIITMVIIEASCVKSITTAEPFPTKTNMEMVLIPAGSFLMGIDGNDLDQRPQHEVYLDAYWMDLTEVTNAQYLACVDDGGCKPPGEAQYYRDQSLRDHPVAYVTWFDARDFCQWAGKRLPTEAEWEKAARGTDGRIFPWGDTPANDRLANYNDNVHKSTPVGSYPVGVSPYGLQDMAGNVWEWVNDWYLIDYYRTSVRENPAGPDTGDRKVLRGGSWFSLVDIVLRTHIRKKRAPEIRDYGTGFRCVFSSD
jgi:formylglycine-generating enzyme required for sulfatase activity